MRTKPGNLANKFDPAIDRQRGEYATLRRLFTPFLSKDQWIEALRAVLGRNPSTPDDYLTAARGVTITCPKCHGTGTFYWHNACGIGYGMCYQCRGRGRLGVKELS